MWQYQPNEPKRYSFRTIYSDASPPIPQKPGQAGSADDAPAPIEIEFDSSFPLTLDPIPAIKPLVLQKARKKEDKDWWIEGHVQPISTDQHTVSEKVQATERFGKCHWGPIDDGYSRVEAAGGLEIWDVKTLIERTRVFQYALLCAREEGKLAILNDALTEKGYAGLGDTVRGDYYGDGDEQDYPYKTVGDMFQSYWPRHYLPWFSMHFGQNIDKNAIANGCDLRRSCLPNRTQH